MLRRQDADILVWMAAMLVFAAVYIWNPPGPAYYPVEGLWSWVAIEGSPGMRWYARFAYAIGASLVSGGLAWAACRIIGHTEQTLSARVIFGLTFLLALVYIAAMGIIVRHELSHLGGS